MTYCLGLLLHEGLVFASDSRTSAGVDSVSRFRKMFVTEVPDERVIVALTAGNLAVTQEVITEVERAAAAGEDEDTVLTADSLFTVARIFGSALRDVHNRDRPHLQAHGADVNASLIVGGQIAGERPRLFHVYAAGNFIEAGEDTCYFQIGETKYGKPILERVVTPALRLVPAAKCALVSFDSTIKANLSVAPPIDLLIYERDRLKVLTHQRIDEGDAYFNALRRYWGEGLRSLFADAPDPDWKTDIT